MKRTQIQLPDSLYATAHKVADSREISLAELARRGLEYMINVSPCSEGNNEGWSIPEAHNLKAADPFANENWREAIHTERLIAAEDKATYRAGKKK